MKSMKQLWAIFDTGVHLTDGELDCLLQGITTGIQFLEARGETGGVLFKARMDQATLLGFKMARKRSLRDKGEVKEDTILKGIPQHPQRQDSLAAQMETLIPFANRLGCYDAAEWFADLVQGKLVIK